MRNGSSMLKALVVLLDLQQQFMHSIRNDNNDITAEFAVSPDSKLSAEQRLNIFRNNYQISLNEALADIFPVLQQLIGETAFSLLARRYLSGHPSNSGNLHDLGQAMADFIVDVEELKSLAYLPDVARLEWMYHRAYHAADHDSFDLQKLTDFDDSDYARLLFTPHPSVILASFDYAAVSIWKAHQSEEITENVDPNQAELVLVHRHQHKVLVSLLSTVEHRFLESLCANQTLAVAAESALSEDESFNLNHALLELVRSDVLVDASLFRG